MKKTILVLGIISILLVALAGCAEDVNIRKDDIEMQISDADIQSEIKEELKYLEGLCFDNAVNNIEILDHAFFAKITNFGSNTNNWIVLIENNESYPVEVEVAISYYNAYGKKVNRISDTWEKMIIAGGTEDVIAWSIASGFDEFEPVVRYEMVVTSKQADETETVGNVEIQNITIDETNVISYSAVNATDNIVIGREKDVYFKENRIVYFYYPGNIYTFQPNSTTEERSYAYGVSELAEYDAVKIYIGNQDK